MKKVSFIIIAVMVFAGQAVSCGKSVDNSTEVLVERKDIVLTKTQMEYVKANNSFAFNLLKEVSKESKAKSFIISPLSVSYAMGMLNNGAAGNTGNQIDKAFGYENGGVAAINEFSKYLMEQSSAVDPSTKIEIANSIVVNKRMSVLKNDFNASVKKYYQAEVFNMDFVTENIVNHINSWCKSKTHDMIPKIVDEVSKETLAYLLNAIYFKGIWSDKFDPAQTRVKDFKKEDGSVVLLDMMHQNEHFVVAQNEIFESICLPYGNKAYRMIVLLPIEGYSVMDIIDKLDPTIWTRNLAEMASCEVDLELPKFETTFDIRLNRALQAMGIADAFDHSMADFSKMSYQQAYVDQVLQKARIKVDEKGTEAAAVTSITMMTTSIGPGNKYYFHADHPFVYAITEVSTGAIYFMGQYCGD